MPPCAQLPSHPLDFSSAAYFAPPPPLMTPSALFLAGHTPMRTSGTPSRRQYLLPLPPTPLIIPTALFPTYRPYSHEDERHALQETLPAPMFPSNYAPMTRCCAYQDDVKPYVLSHQG